MYVIVKILGVGRVGVCMLCPCVSEKHGNGEGVDCQEIFRLSDTRKYMSLDSSTEGGGIYPRTGLISNSPTKS